jgi:hypothetical protein
MASHCFRHALPQEEHNNEATNEIINLMMLCPSKVTFGCHASERVRDFNPMVKSAYEPSGVFRTHSCKAKIPCAYIKKSRRFRQAMCDGQLPTPHAEVNPETVLGVAWVCPESYCQCAY